ncbi:putative D,D-dipeptide transport system permease protein DdpC [Burkholderia cepacia]|nr:putative D,D-dipeptide transport system permease protein DdpC [Burkholderia cepacia]
MSTPVDLTLRAPATSAAAGWLRRHPGLALAAVYLLLNAIAVIAPGWLAHYDPLAADPLAAQLGSSAEHWLGTDQLGRDIFSRVVYGARYSLSISAAAIASRRCSAPRSGCLPALRAAGSTS